MDGTDVSEQTNQSAVEETAPQGAAADVVATAVEVAEESTASAAEAGTVSEPAASSEDGELDAASLMEQFLNDPSHDYKSLKYGDVMDGVIMHLDREEILVDIGSKSEGIVPSREYSVCPPTSVRRWRSATPSWSSWFSLRILKATRWSASTGRVRRRAGGACRSCMRPTRSSKPR